MLVGRATVVAAVLAAGTATTVAAMGSAQADDSIQIRNVPYANAKFGIQNDVLTPSASEQTVAWGALPLTNADTANGVTHYGYNTSNGGPLTQAPNEAQKTEPDQNVYLVFRGKHYLYQGHELGPRGYITRINLDETDPTKRVTLIADQLTDNTAFPPIDGITWDPWTKQLLFTAESASPTGGVFAVALDASGNSSAAATRMSVIGSGGYEGIHNDNYGNVWIVEDIGGAAAGGGKVPNSYVYRFVPTNKSDLTRGGTLQALQVMRSDGTPVTAGQLQANPSDPFISALHTYGTSFGTRWVTVHDAGGSTPFNSTAAAAAASATPFKRPENGVFRPGTNFGEFYFTETGDTTNTSTLPGAYGGVFKLSQSNARANSGRVSLVAAGDLTHTGFDNISFLTADTLLVVEDAGDSLHSARNALDSGYAYDLTSSHGITPVRWLAEGRDSSATYDSLGGPSYNEGDNEITGTHVSDGDPTQAGILGAKVPDPTSSSWRTFWTQQHGDNETWEVTWSF